MTQRKELRSTAAGVTADRSLRSESTIITFSARSFSDGSRVLARRRFAFGAPECAIVPLMERAWMRRPSSLRNRSGDAIVSLPWRSSAAKRAGSDDRSPQ